MWTTVWILVVLALGPSEGFVGDSFKPVATTPSQMACENLGNTLQQTFEFAGARFSCLSIRTQTPVGGP